MRNTSGLASALILIAAAASAQPSSDAVLSDELNSRLPAWLRLGGEYRTRVEAVSGLAFREGSSDSWLLHRLRLNLRLIPSSWLKFEFQAQDARVFWRNQKPSAPPYENTVDLRMAYVELGDFEHRTVSVRAGRQEINLGDQRLVGSSNWTNTARTFDAARLHLRSGGYRLDAFSATVVQQVNDDFDRPFRVKGDDLHGLYGGIEKLLPRSVIEPYLLWRVSHASHTSFFTIGTRATGGLPAHFDYNIEVAGQTGSIGAASMRAWAGHWQAGYNLAARAWKPRLIAEYNFATGDKNPRDAIRGTFDVLYPTGHDKTGLADQVGWKNIHDLRTGAQLHPGRKLLVAPIYHSYWLASATDALYSSSGAPVVQRADGSAGRRVGQETDLSMLYTPRHIQIGAGIAHLFPGRFLKTAAPGHGYTFGYVMFDFLF